VHHRFAGVPEASLLGGVTLGVLLGGEPDKVRATWQRPVGHGVVPVGMVIARGEGRQERANLRALVARGGTQVRVKSLSDHSDPFVSPLPSTVRDLPDGAHSLARQALTSLRIDGSACLSPLVKRQVRRAETSDAVLPTNAGGCRS
jgi:hypothetical protein